MWKDRDRVNRVASLTATTAGDLRTSWSSSPGDDGEITAEVVEEVDERVDGGLVVAEEDDDLPLPPPPLADVVVCGLFSLLRPWRSRFETDRQ